MKSLTFKELYQENGQTILEINILPEKFCNFDCIFCPIGRSKNKTDQPITFHDSQANLSELAGLIKNTKPDLVFINSKGESFINDNLTEIIQLIKSENKRVRLLTNGYMLGQEPYQTIANLCDEIIGEIKVTHNEHFQKIQRPVSGYTLDAHVHNMASFKKQYQGKFIFEITIVKGYNDDAQSVEALKHMIEGISPDEIQVVRIEDEPFKTKLGISKERLEEITTQLMLYR